VRIANEILMYFRSQKKTMGDVSLSDVLDTDGEGNSLSLMDVLAQDDEMSERIGELELCGRLRSLVDSVLNEREANIIRLRYGLDGKEPMTQRETAKVCKISRSYVSRLEKKALERLKEELGGDDTGL
jgi:RNA polymerase sporulation-specific sigma factor